MLAAAKFCGLVVDRETAEVDEKRTERGARCGYCDGSAEDTDEFLTSLSVAPTASNAA